MRCEFLNPVTNIRAAVAGAAAIRSLTKLALTIGFFVAGFASLPIAAGDWPQILGPGRNGQSFDQPLPLQATDAKLLWQFPCGSGYAGVAVADQRVFVWHRLEDREQLDCLAAADGKSLWTLSFPTQYQGGVDPDIGPRCVPVVFGNRVLVYGAGGDLHLASVDQGQEIWSRSLGADYHAEEGYFGAGSTPLVVSDPQAGDRIIVAVGGRPKAGLVALDASNGKTLWTSLDSEAAYASPTTIELAGKKLVLAVMRLKTFVVDPSDGQTVLEIPFGQRGPTVNASSPLVDGSEIFLTASYGIGCRKLDLAQDSPRHAWSDDEVISSQYVTPVKVNQSLFANTGREDMRNAGLVCVDWKSGKLQWSRPDYGVAHPIAIGNQILLQGIQGKVEWIQADPKAFTTLATTQLPSGTYRALPAFSQGVLYSRRILPSSSRNGAVGEIVAFRLAAE